MILDFMKEESFEKKMVIIVMLIYDLRMLRLYGKEDGLDDDEEWVKVSIIMLNELVLL